MDKDTGKIVLYAVVGLGVLYVLYKVWTNVSGAVASVTSPATTALANWYTQLTSNGQPIPQGFVLFPDGTSVSLAQVNVTAVPNSATQSGISGTFTYNGQTWYLNSPHDANGNYAANTSLTG